MKSHSHHFTARWFVAFAFVVLLVGAANFFAGCAPPPCGTLNVCVDQGQDAAITDAAD